MPSSPPSPSVTTGRELNVKSILDGLKNHSKYGGPKGPPPHLPSVICVPPPTTPQILDDRCPSAMCHPMSSVMWKRNSQPARCAVCLAAL